MKLFTLYIGTAPRSSASPPVDIPRLQELLGAAFPSFTLLQAEGVFRGQSERTFVVKVTAPDVIALLEEVAKLRQEFDQDGIGIEHEGNYHRVTEDFHRTALLCEMYPCVRAGYFDTVFKTSKPAAEWPGQFAVITAHNPEGERHAEAANEQLDSELAAACRERGLRCWRVIGASEDSTHAEAGYGVQTDLGTALSLARRFRQEAIYWVNAGHLSLVSCIWSAVIPLGLWDARVRQI